MMDINSQNQTPTPLKDIKPSVSLLKDAYFWFVVIVILLLLSSLPIIYKFWSNPKTRTLPLQSEIKTRTVKIDNIEKQPDLYELTVSIYSPFKIIAKNNTPIFIVNKKGLFKSNLEYLKTGQDLNVSIWFEKKNNFWITKKIYVLEDGI